MSTANDSAEPSPAPRRPWFKYLLIGGAGLVVLLVMAVVGLRLYFSDSYFKAQLSQVLEQQLGRPCTIGELEAGLLAGKVSLRDLRIQSAKAQDGATAPLVVGRLDAQVALWTLISSRFSEARNARVEVDGLKLTVQRRLEDGRWVTDWDDVIAKLTAGPPGVWPKETGLKALDFQVHVKNSDLSLQDQEFGEMTFAGMELDASQAAPGQPLAYKLSGGLRTPRQTNSGRIQTEGEVVWLDAQGRVGPGTLSGIKCGLAIQEADLGHLAQYAGLVGAANDGALRWTLGRAFSGELKLQAADLKTIGVSFGMDTDQLVNVWQVAGGSSPRWKAGILPARLVAQLEGHVADGGWEAGPLNVGLDVAANRAELGREGGARWLTLRLNSQHASSSDEPFRLSLRADVTGLCSTDIGSALGLKDQYGGVLEANASVKDTPDHQMWATGDVKTQQFFVAVGGVRQPSGLQLDYDLKVARDAQGRVDQVSGKVSAKGRPFQITTIEDLKLTSLATPEKVQGNARLRMAINGRELWAEFGPLLKVVNMGAPLEEALNGDLALSSAAGTLKGSFQGTLQRQHQEPKPIFLSAGASCELAVRDRMDGKPFAQFDVQLRSAQDKSFSVKTTGQLARTKETETWELSEFTANGELGALGNLNERLGKYVRFFLGPEYDVKGYFSQKAHSKLVRQLGPDGEIREQRVEVATELQLNKLDLRGPALVKDGAPLQWQEDDVSLQLDLVQGTKHVDGVGFRDTVAIPKVVLKSGSLNVVGDLAEVDVAALTHAVNATDVGERFKRWAAAMPSTSLDASVESTAVGRLQKMGILPPEALMTGGLRVKARHLAEQHRVDIENLELVHPDWSVRFSAEGLNVEALRTHLLEPPKNFSGWQALVPSFQMQAALQPRGTAQIQTLLREERQKASGKPADAKEQPLWEDPLLSGKWVLSAAYDAAKGVLAITDLNCAVGAGTAKITMPGASVGNVLRFLDVDRVDLPAIAPLLTDCTVEAAAGPLMLRRLTPLLPKGMDLTGLLRARVRYETAKDRLYLERLEFARTEGSPCCIAKIALTKEGGEAEEINGVQSLLKELDFTKPMHVLAGTVANHLPKGFRIHEIEAATPELLGFLKSLGVGGALVEDARAGVYRLSDRIRLTGVSARKGDAGGQYELFASANVQAAWHPRMEQGVPRSTSVAGLSGALKISPLVVKLAPSRMEFDGTLLLDDAGLSFNYLDPYFVYEKPLGQPCRLQAAVGLPEEGGVEVPSVTLNGGPLTVALSKLQQSPAGAWTCVQLDLRDGPLPGRFSDFLYDVKADRLQVAFNADQVSLSKAVQYATLPKTFTADGALSNVCFSYNGRLSVLPDRMGEQDRAEVKCDLHGVVLRGRPLGKSVDVSIAGSLAATPYVLSSQGLDVGMDYGATGQPAISQRMNVQVERVAARNAKLALPTAALTEGLPLLVRGRLQFGTPCNVDALLDGIATLAESIRSGPVKDGPTDLRGIAMLRLELSAGAPSVMAGGQTLTNLQAPQILFDSLKLSIPLANAEAFGGQLILREALYDVSSSPIKHSQKIMVSGIDLHAITSDPTQAVAKDSYQIFGKLSATGSLSGVGFLQRERTSWQGEFKATLNDLVAQRGDGKPQGGAFGKKALGMLGGILGGNVGQSMALYGDDFGLFLSRMEFEPCEINVTMDRGRAKVPQGLLTGRGQNAGLQMGFLGYVDLPTESFTPGFSVWPFSLPPSTRKMMKLDELTPAEQETIMQEFRIGTYHIVITGPLTAPKTNSVEFAASFQGVLGRIDRMIAAHKAAPPPPPPPAPAPAPAP